MNKSIEHRLAVLKNSGVVISHFLDIGAYRGEFTRVVKTHWPEVKVWQIEADERQQPWLQTDAIVALLSDKPNQELDFFTLNNENSITTGSSVYKELTQYYKNPIVVKKRTTTLDDVAKRVNFRGNWKNSGLMKLDTQGSELDILRGSENFLATYQPKYMIIETSVKPYNLEAPLVGDVIDYMRTKDYQILDIMHCMYDNNESLLQIDILFNKK
jgi:FkbM family methyltransferase